MASGRIGEVLQELGYLTADRLAQAERSANGDGLRFGEHLCRLGFAHEDDIAHGLSVQAGIAQVDVAEREVSREALACVPADLAQRYRVLALAVTDGRLEVAMADPFDLEAVDDLSAQALREQAGTIDLAGLVERLEGLPARASTKFDHRSRLGIADSG